MNLPNLKPETRARLEKRAAAHGPSVQDEAADIIRSALQTSKPPMHDSESSVDHAKPGLGTRIAQQFEGIGLTDDEHALI